MKRFFSTVACCTCLLVLLSYLLFPVSSAAENPLLVLLNLPAPPPPNPQVSLPPRSNYPPDLFSKGNPPPDDAPIDVLMEYWRTQAEDYNEIRHKVYPSEKALDRLLAAIEKEPEKLPQFLSILPPGSRSAEFVKGIYDGVAMGSEKGYERRSRLKQWMKYNTPYFSAELAREASRVADNEGYVTHHRELLALARVDWERAGPIVARLYGNPANKASHTAALWALYLHAIASGSPGDTDRYRDELKNVVADRSLSAGIRDLALDALSLEKEWSGRDEWYISLMEDETLLELGGYTGLTTLIISSPEEKYIDRMIALLESDNINVRSAAARNLVGKLNTSRPEIIKALLPWVSNAKWLKLNTSGRETLLRALTRVKIPDSVPVLIAALDEKDDVRRYTSANANVNAMETAAQAMRSAANAAAAAANAAAYEDDPRTFVVSSSNMAANTANTAAFAYAGDPYPLRQAAISALAHQEDPRAVPALRRLLGEIDQPYLSAALVAAIFHCGGFPIGEQVDALESVARNPEALNIGTGANVAVNAPYYGANAINRPNFTIYDKDGRVSTDVKHLLGAYLAQLEVVRDELARAVVERIGSLDRSDAKTAQALRKIVLRWPAPAVYALLLGDLKNNRTDPEAIIQLLSLRKTLRETQPTDVFEIRTGSQIALGISACLLEVPSDFDSILDGGSDEAKTAMLACARLIRTPLPVAKVAENLQSKDKLLALAAERYLESEDSPEARRIVLSLHPNAAKIMGATMAFFVDEDAGGAERSSLYSLFATVSPFYDRFGSYGFLARSSLPVDPIQFERSVREEIVKKPDLLGVYNWKENFVHIYKDRAVLSWRDDPARYSERVLSKDEFDDFKELIARYKADDLPPFLECSDCEHRQLLMLGRNGGRRVYVMTEMLPPFFADLERMFDELRQPRASVKYWAGKDVPGLEVLFADDRLDAIAVWKNGTDFRLLTADKVRRQEVDNEIAAVGESRDEGDDEGLEQEGQLEKERLRRQYENFEWFSFAAGSLGAQATQPIDVPYIPTRDTLDVAASQQQWKARTAAFELRSDENGLYKVAAGKVTKIRTGLYTNVVVTPNGRWAIATKLDDEHGERPVRINLLTNREYVIDPGDLPAYRPIAFVSSINRVLLGPYEYHHGYDRHDGDEDEEDNEADGRLYSLLDPVSGTLIPVRGEVRPLVHQTFRPLQPASAAFEYWAAIPKDKGTVVGIYNTRTFTMKPVLTLPKITFDSMDIWVDAAEGKLYFVYEGHLLAAPIKAGR